MNRTRSILVGACLLLLLTACATAAEEGWSLSKLNPFSQSTTKKKTMSKVRKAEPSALDKVTSGTKSALSKTNQALNPWAKKSTPTSKRTGTSQAANRPKSTEKKSMLNWFGKEEEPRQPKTVSEFISQPKPK